jgi:hypothetical protein
MLCLLFQTPTAIFAEKVQSDDTCKLNTAKENQLILKGGFVSVWAGKNSSSRGEAALPLLLATWDPKQDVETVCLMLKRGCRILLGFALSLLQEEE